jgi:uncharacterized membrane protein YgdD (TMEM256/DUF423 family)
MTGRGRIWIVVGALSGFLAVGLGAFGAHGLERVATEGQLAWWRTAALYHLLHAPALVLAGVIPLARPGPRVVGTAFLLGTVIFSGTLYALALGAPRWLGAVTPVGGLALMVGWLGLALGAWRSRD